VLDNKDVTNGVFVKEEKKLFSYMEVKALIFLVAAKTAVLVVTRECNNEKEGSQQVEEMIDEILATIWRSEADENK